MLYQPPLEGPVTDPGAGSRVSGWLRRLQPWWLRIERWCGLSALELHRTDLALAVAGETPGVTTRWLSVSEAVGAAGDAALGIAPVWARRAYTRGDRCLAAFVDGRLAGYLWASRGKALAEERLAVRIPDDAQYRFKTFVRAADRGRGIAPALSRAADHSAAAAGLTHALLCIDPFDEPSLVAARHSGARRVGFVVTWRFGGRVRAWRSRGAARNGLHLRP